MSLPSVWRRSLSPGLLLLLLAGTAAPAHADRLPQVDEVEFQPLSAQVRRVVEAYDLLGQPLPPRLKARLENALNGSDQAQAVHEIQEILDPLCLIGVTINPESRVKVAPGPADANLVQHGWRVFLVKVQTRRA